MTKLLTCPITLQANPTVDVRPGRFVVITAAGVVESSDGGPVDGINHTDFKAADYTAGKVGASLLVTINPGCIDEVVGSTAIPKGANVASAAGGKAKVAATGNVITGRAYDAITADAEVVSVMFGYRGTAA